MKFKPVTSAPSSSFLAKFEDRFVYLVLPRIPPSIGALDLTRLGFTGAAMATLGLIGCNFSLFWLSIVVLGIALNWFCNLLDGPLARFRNDDSQRSTFIIDHTCDLFSLIMLIIAFGLSPFLSLPAALMILLCFLLFSSYLYIRTTVRHVHRKSYIGLGATEFRLLMIFWAILAAICGLKEPLVQGVSRVDAAIFLLSGTAIVGLGVKACMDAYLIAIDEGKPSASPARVPSKTND